MMNRLRWAALLVLALALGGCILPVASSGSTCVLCRLYRRTTTYAGLPIVRDHGNDCSLWYRDHVDPSHDHLWEKSSCTRFGDLWGLWRGWACGFGNPIFSLAPDIQQEVYEHFADPLEARALFASFADGSTKFGGVDGGHETRGELLVYAMIQWKLAGFPGTWGDWWAGWYADHLDDLKSVEQGTN